MARSRESLWLWAGATLVAVAVALGGAAVALDAVRAGYRLWSSGPIIAAYVAAVLAAVAFWAAVRDWPFPFAADHSGDVPGAAPSAGDELAEQGNGARDGAMGGGGGAAAVTGNIPGRPAAYQARDEQLAALRRHAGAATGMVYVVAGMRGVGKTQVAAAYARECAAAGWQLVAWVNASHQGLMLDGLAEAAAAVGVPTLDDQQATARSLRRWLEADGSRCLLVLDDLADPHGVLEYLPAAGGAQVIITSTSRPAGGDWALVPVEVFAPTRAQKFLADRTGRDDMPGASEIAAELGYLPLALAQAGAMIAAQRITYGTLLERLREFPVEQYLSADLWDPYPHGTGAAILLAVRAAQEDDALGLAQPVLSLVALLSRAGVTRELLHIAAGAGAFSRPMRRPLGKAGGQPSAAEVDVVLGRLAGASLLAFSTDGSAIEAHQLTMRVMRELMVRDGTLAAAAATAVAVLRYAREPAKPPWQHPTAARDLVQQIMSLATHLAPHAGYLASGTAEGLLELRSWAVWCVNELGDNPSQAIMIGQQVVDDREQILGTDHPDTLTSQNNLAYAYQSAGQLAEAIRIYEKTLASRERTLGADHPDTLASQNNLAHGYESADRLAEAIPLYEKTLADSERILGPDYPATLTAQNNLAGGYHSAGRLGQAIPLYEKTLADCERVLGPDHPDTLGSQNNLARCYESAGRLAESIPLYEKTLADRERVLGPNHPDTLASHNNLASGYESAGRPNDAILLYEKTLADCERVLGPDHPYTLGLQNNLAHAYQSVGRTSDAMPLYEKTLADSERVLGPDHPQTLGSRNNLEEARSMSPRE